MKIRTLIIDDSILFRKLVTRVAGEFSDIDVVATESSGEGAYETLKNVEVDLVFCDVHLPGWNGFETLMKIKEENPAIIVIMMSSISGRNAEIVIKSLENGALDFLRKPEGNSPEQSYAHLKREMGVILSLVRIHRNFAGIKSKSLSRSAHPVRPAPTSSPAMRIPSRFSICAIGVSTGGPEALGHVLPQLPVHFPVPIVLVQHMPGGFTRSLAESLQKKSRIRIQEGEDGQVLQPGTVYIAPGGRHMIVRNSEGGCTIGINDAPHENSCRPSVDVLFRSVAAAYGDTGILAAVLTGMGNDGVNGVKAMKRKGCFCITQSEQSCVVYGMPRAVVESGFSDTALPVDKIAGEMCARLHCSL